MSSWFLPNETFSNKRVCQRIKVTTVILKHTKVYVTVLYCVNIQLWYKIIIDTTRKNNFYRMWINSELSVSDEITQNCHGYQNVRIRKPRSKTMISTECFAKMTESAIDYFLKFWLSQILTVTIVCVLALLAMEVCVCRSHVRTRPWSILWSHLKQINWVADDLFVPVLGYLAVFC